jgi:hypothetical protein
MDKKRNRRTLALTAEGRDFVRTAVDKYRGRVELGYGKFSLDRLSYAANISISTLKRLLAGKHVDSSSFYALLNALNLEVQDNHVQKRSVVFEVPISPQPVSNFAQHSTGVFMTVKFPVDNLSHIKRAINHLQDLLIDVEVIYSENKDAVTVSGDFSESDREHIEMTIEWIKKYSTSHKVTW